MHVAITGASSGIGAALVREYVRRGAAVTLVARRADLLEKLAKEVDGKTHCAPVDLADFERARDWIAPAEAALGPIDVLVNNAGVELVAPTISIDWARVEQLLTVNLRTPLRLTQTVLPAMLARGSGAIVDVASAAAFTTLPGMYFYGASKAGLAAASESLRGELRKTGVHVVTVYPGPVRTDMGGRAMGQYGENFLKKLTVWGTAEELARRVASAVERKKPRVIYPSFYKVQRWFPNLSRWIADRSPPLKVVAKIAPRAGEGPPRGS